MIVIVTTISVYLAVYKGVPARTPRRRRHRDVEEEEESAAAAGAQGEAGDAGQTRDRAPEPDPVEAL